MREGKVERVISDRTEGMINASASYYQESQLFYDIMNAKARGYDHVNDQIEDLSLQLSPFTATWGLVYWEESVGLPRKPTEDYEQRRPAVLTRLLNYENFGVPMVLRIAEAYSTKVDVNINCNECLVTVTFYQGIPDRLNEFKKNVEQIIHAHLGLEFRVMYQERCVLYMGAKLLTAARIRVKCLGREAV